MAEVMTPGIGIALAIVAVYYILQVIADWKILSKAGRPGILSLIPVVNVCAEYSICWSGFMGLVYVVLLGLAGSVNGNQDVSSTMQTVASVSGAAAGLIHIIQSIKLARSFGKGFLYGLLLILFGPLARIFLGLGDSRYRGKR